MANTEADHRKHLSFEEGWPVLQEAINNVIHSIEAAQQNQITSEEYMRTYTIVYEMCKFNPHGPEPQKLYEQYQKTFEDYTSTKVLPQLRGKNNENLMKELVKQWDNHKITQRWLSRFFHYLDRYFIRIRKLPSLQQTSR